MPERSKESILARNTPISTEINHAREFKGTRSLRKDTVTTFRNAVNSTALKIKNLVRHEGDDTAGKGGERIGSAFVSPLEIYKTWLDELHDELTEQSQKVDRIIEGLLKADRIFTVATGRSELMMRIFGTRLMHEGYDVFRIGESYTPAIGNDPKRKDVLLIFTGSGKTSLVLRAEKIAKEKNVPIYGVCSNVKSEAVIIAGEQNIIITKGKRIFPEGAVPPEDKQPINFLQTKSEFKAFCIGELIVNATAIAKGLTEDDFRSRHANTE